MPTWSEAYTNELIKLIKKYIAEPSYDNLLEIHKHTYVEFDACVGVPGIRGLACSECPAGMRNRPGDAGWGICILSRVWRKSIKRQYEAREGEFLLALVKLLVLIEQGEDDMSFGI